MSPLTPEQLLAEIQGAANPLIVQDLDGVCMDLVKDPLTRTMDRRYVEAAAQMHGRFVVLTNGEHEGKRGVNRLVEAALGDVDRAKREGLYLPGLAGGGVQLQDHHGTLSHPGVSDAEMDFLAALPARMEAELKARLPALMPQLSPTQLQSAIQQAVLDTQVSPTINLNGLFGYCGDDVQLQRQLQLMLQELMDALLNLAEQAGLGSSFFSTLPPIWAGMRRAESGSSRQSLVMWARLISSSCSEARLKKRDYWC